MRHVGLVVRELAGPGVRFHIGIYGPTRTDGPFPSRLDTLSGVQKLMQFTANQANTTR
jgi:hypothetical protein